MAVAPGGTAPDNAVTYYSVVGETLNLYQLGFTKTDSITTDEISVKIGDASYSASTPTFSGETVKIDGTVTPAGTVSQPTFTGQSDTVTVD